MAETADRILQAADELFSLRGYAAVSARDIAERAGVNKALIFYYFESKEALFRRVLDQYYEGHVKALELPTEGSYRERLHTLIDHYLDFIEDNYRYLQLVQREIIEGSSRLPYIQQNVMTLYSRVRDLLGDLVPASGALDARQFFVSFSGLINTFYVNAPVLGELWAGQQMDAAQRLARREHLHWIVNTLLDRLESGK
ncbi:MAG: TetR family transcriptional regulator [Deltaproteobacteria bacterium]|nr:TetR family transcriptional regulator [Deltaproteobacteria bacterium]